MLPLFSTPDTSPGAPGKPPGFTTETVVSIASDDDVITARQQGRAFALRLGFSLLEATLVATAISELARNIVLYAQRGDIVLRAVERDGRQGVLVIARDEGPGIPDVEQAAAGGPSCLKLGLRGLKRLMDDLQIDSTPGRGTTITATKWKT
jgi:serine/threonine-protein kinase RsbT